MTVLLTTPEPNKSLHCYLAWTVSQVSTSQRVVAACRSAIWRAYWVLDLTR